jgi:hypothetical protein
LRVSDFVPRSAIDQVAVFARGASNLCQQDFSLCKCIACGGIYLLDSIDTLYLDGNDLQRQVQLGKGGFRCVHCGAAWDPASHNDAAFAITWAELRESAWSWVATPLRSFGDPV